MQTMGATVTQWDIYDSYMELMANAQREAELTSKVSSSKSSSGVQARMLTGQGEDEDVIHSAAMGKSLKILERMVNQNEEDEIFQDFKYWEDQSDQFRDGEGSLLPLWRFSTEQRNESKLPVSHGTQNTKICLQLVTGLTISCAKEAA